MVLLRGCREASEASRTQDIKSRRRKSWKKVATEGALEFLKKMDQQGWVIMGVRMEQDKEEEGEDNREWLRSGGVVDLSQSRVGLVDLTSSGRSEREKRGDEDIHRSSSKRRRGRSSSCHLPTIAEDQELTLERRRQRPKLELFTIEE